MPRGRPKLPAEERTVHVSVRIPLHVYEFYRQYPNLSKALRVALELVARRKGET